MGEVLYIDYLRRLWERRCLRLRLRRVLERRVRRAPPFRGIGTFLAPTPPGKLVHRFSDVGVPGHETGAGIILLNI